MLLYQLSEKMEGSINWDAYFPMPNERNKERIQYIVKKEIEKSGELVHPLPNYTFRRLYFLLDKIGEELLSHCTEAQVTSSGKIKLFWVFKNGSYCQLWLMNDAKISSHIGRTASFATRFKGMTRSAFTSGNLTHDEVIEKLKEALILFYGDNN